MNVRHLLITGIASVALAGCDDEGSHRRLGTSPPPAEAYRATAADAGAASEPQNPVVTTAPPPPPTRPRRDAGAREEIDNTIYWDAATKPTADNVRDVDAGVPDR